MRIDEIVALSKAGFTAEQIAQMNVAQAQQPVQQPQPQQQPVQQPQPQQQPVQQPQPQQPQPQQQPVQQTQPQQQTPNPMDALMQQVMNLTNIVQANALGNTQMPTPENADDILAAIINPPEKDKK